MTQLMKASLQAIEAARRARQAIREDMTNQQQALPRA